ncbi:protocadherin-23-like [Dreissena polymorpha]|uniref:protocadherin-23-like n=1 Tax=Dreissena polymorpha TaxID=45954 RepID=UPI002264A936|nr:protocadherin-23-like [Dreissena polymorpha]
MISFTISATDNGSPPLSVSENYSLVVLDVNERPSAITLIDLPILLENTTIGSAVCRLNIADEDVNERLGLEITTGMDVFKIQGLNCSMSPLRSIRTGSMINGTLCTASILLNKKLDYETSKSPIVLRTKASDKGSLFATGEFKFTLMNSNEPPYDIILDTAVKEVPENTPNFVIGTFVTKDEDVGDKHKYQILTNWEFFTTVGNKLIVKAGLDYETKRSYNVTVRSTDSGEIPLSLTKTFTIEVKDLNEKPSNIVFTSSELQRDAVPGSIVNIVTVEDPDNLKRPGFQTHNCTLTPSDVLAIAQGEMTIKVRSTIPKEASSLVVTITCTDTGVPSMYINQTLTKRIVDRVKPPKNLLFTSKNGGHDITVDENAPNIDLGQLSVINQLTKEVIDGVYTFALEEASKDYLSLTERTLRLTKPLDFETQSTKSFLVNVNGSDTFGDAFNITHIFTINVVDINEAPFGIDLRGKMSVKENSPEGAVVGTLFTHDSEDYQTYTYTILGVQYGIAANETDTVMINAFKIEGNMLKVGASRYLDYEQSPVVAVYMETVDSGEPPMTYRSVVLLRIDNDNDPPTDIRLSHNEVTENSKTGTFVGELIVNDEDIDQQQACEIVNVVDVPFRVVESTKLVVAGTIDYEMHNSLNMEVKCGDIILDGTHLHFTKTLAVLVLNVNEPPENISLSNAAIDEGNTVGQLIGEITATDLDSANLTFTIVQDNIGTPFQIKGTSTLIVNMVFDFETKASYNISITVTDEQGLFNTRRFEILVRDINEPPTAIHLDKNTISENTQTGALIGTFTTEDSDIGQKFVYTLDGQTQLNGLLEIRGSKLYVGSKQLDFETKPEISITVISMDNGIPSKFRAVYFFAILVIIVLLVFVIVFSFSILL